MARVTYDKRLAKHPLLDGCSRQELAMLSRHATPVKRPKGKQLMSRSGPPREFLLLESGTASVTVEGRPVAELGDGDFFGEMAFLDDDYIRRAEIVAETEMEIFVFDARGFRQLMQEVPFAADRIREAAESRQN